MERAVTPKHHVELQSMRGVAALIVVLAHAAWIFQLQPGVKLLATVALNAHASVVFFFVLSGYVLSASLLKGPIDWDRTLAFYLRRVFRIYPTVIVASALGLAYLFLLSPTPITGMSAWGSAFYDLDAITASKIALAFLAVGTYLVDPVTTILTELIGSALLPWFVRVTRARLAPSAWLVVLLAVLSVPLQQAPHRFNVLMYMVDFALGATLASLPRSRRPVPNLVASASAVLGIALAYFARPVWFLLTTGTLQPLEFDYHNPWISLLEGAGSAMLIYGVMAKRPPIAFLRTRALAYLGDISYSVYLLHFPVVFALAHLVNHLPRMSGEVRATGLIAGALTCVLPLAALSYRWIEVPCISAGRFVAQRAGQLLQSGERVL